MCSSDRYFYSNLCPESNFYKVEGGVTHNGINLPTSEHHFMYAKAMLMGDHESAARIKAAKTPGQAKQLGRRVKPFDHKLWTDSCEEIVTGILVSKFSTPNLKAYLLSIEGNIYEASPTDKIWGIGISVKDAENGATHNGRNLLGKCLMKTRDILRESL